MNKRHLIPVIILTLVMIFLCGASAFANERPLYISMALSSYTFSEPQEIKVAISVTNAGESDLPGPATLYYPNGDQVEEFGSPILTVGTVKSIIVPWKVTQQQLETGLVTFKLRYSMYNDEGELVNRTVNFSKRIIYTSDEGQSWDCPTCGRKENTDSFCGTCGTARPDGDIHYDYKVGDIITFGHYEQDNSTTNGAEWIEWIVLDYDAERNCALLISRYGLDAKAYDAMALAAWPDSDIRTWLNHDFINNAFTTYHQ